MMKRGWLAAMGVGTAAVITGLGLAVASGPMGAMGNPERMEKLISKRVGAALADLKATDAQKEKVNALKTATVADMKAFIKTHQQTRQEALALWNAAAPDAKAAHVLVDQRIDAMRALAHRMADRALELHAALTPAQRAQLSERIKHHRGDHGLGGADRSEDGAKSQ